MNKLVGEGTDLGADYNALEQLTKRFSVTRPRCGRCGCSWRWPRWRMWPRRMGVSYREGGRALAGEAVWMEDRGAHHG